MLTIIIHGNDLHFTEFWKISHMGALEMIEFGGFYLEQKNMFEIFKEFSCNLRH